MYCWIGAAGLVLRYGIYEVRFGTSVFDILIMDIKYCTKVIRYILIFFCLVRYSFDTVSVLYQVFVFFNLVFANLRL